MIKIDNIIGFDAYISNGLKLDVRKIGGVPSNGATIEQTDDGWEVVDMSEPPKPC